MITGSLTKALGPVLLYRFVQSVYAKQDTVGYQLQQPLIGRYANSAKQVSFRCLVISTCFPIE